MQYMLSPVKPYVTRIQIVSTLQSILKKIGFILMDDNIFLDTIPVFDPTPVSGLLSILPGVKNHTQRNSRQHHTELGTLPELLQEKLHEATKS